MLLPYEDFIKDGEYPADGNIQPGPFTKILEPLIAPLRTRPLREDTADKQAR